MFSPKSPNKSTEPQPLGIYVHVPFCRSKCEYCDFYSLAGGMNKESMDLYLQAILAHIRESAQRQPIMVKPASIVVLTARRVLR